MKILWIAAMLSLLFGCFSPKKYKNKDQIVKSMAATITKQFKNVPQLSIEKLQEMQNSGEKIILVDVREAKERSVSYLPASISKEDFENNKDKFKDHTVVAYCTIGHRSSQYIQKLDKQNFKAAYNLEESILGWTHRKLPVVNDKGETKKVHVYDDPWNLVEDSYEGVTE